MTITIRIDKNYGREAIYPAGEISDLLLRLTGKKTFSRHDLAIIKELGYEIAVEQPELV